MRKCTSRFPNVGSIAREVNTAVGEKSYFAGQIHFLKSAKEDYALW